MNINKKILKKSIECRKFQIMVNNYMLEQKIRIPVHLAFGHEFVSSLVYSFFNMKKDKLLLTHRNIHFTSIFSSKSVKNYKNFIFDKINKNQNLGSMNYLDNNSPIAYTSSILGNNFSVACGVAETQKKKNGITICVSGDGAIEEGSFYEAIQLSKYLNLKIIFLIENNDWSMATSTKQRRCEIYLDKLAETFKIKYFNFKRSTLKKNIIKYKKVINLLKTNSEPVICEFEVNTLGALSQGKKKFIYHHGPMKLNLDRNKYVYRDDRDILNLIEKNLF